MAVISDVSPAPLWHYVFTEDDPADDCSRWLYGPAFVSCCWFTGPKILSLNGVNGPVDIVTSETESADSEVANPIVICSVLTQVHRHPNSSLLKESSSWTKCLRAIAYHVSDVFCQKTEIWKTRSNFVVNELNWPISSNLKVFRGMRLLSWCSWSDLDNT